MKKKLRVLILSLLIIIPTILCIILFSKVNSLQKQIDILMIDKYGKTYNQTVDKNASIVHASNKLKTQEAKDDSKVKNSKINGANSDKDTQKDKDQVLHKGEETQVNEPVQTKEPTKPQNQVQTEKPSQTKEQDQVKDRKKVYLTFDDGPSNITPQVLDILNEYDVKATFFVIGKTDDFSKSIYKRIVDEGHTIALHSYTHKYDEIYSSLENFKYDLLKLQDLIYETTNHKPYIYRFPGGSANTVSDLDISILVKYLEGNNFTYYDWNVVNGDGTSNSLTAKESYDNVIEGVKEFNNSVVLMHDSEKKASTVKSLSNIIETLLENDVEILPITEEVKPVQQVKVSDVMNK